MSPAFMQTGGTSIALVATDQGSTTVTFAKAFASAPRIAATVTSHATYFPTVLSVSTTGFTLYVQHHASTPASVTVTVDWAAISA